MLIMHQAIEFVLPDTPRSAGPCAERLDFSGCGSLPDRFIGKSQSLCGLPERNGATHVVIRRSSIRYGPAGGMQFSLLLDVWLNFVVYTKRNDFNSSARTAIDPKCAFSDPLLGRAVR